jgi:hypothetical protein
MTPQLFPATGLLRKEQAMNQAKYSELHEIRWRRPLTPEETAQVQSWLAAHPEATAGWAEETALSGLLQQLPDVPVASNFTARVMQEIERENTALEPVQWGRWWWAWLTARWMPRVAVAGLVLCLSLLGYFQHRTVARTKLVASLASFPTVAALNGQDKQLNRLLSVEVFKDFDTVRHLAPEPPMVDMDLLTVLK